jgi:hypothetical protein
MQPTSTGELFLREATATLKSQKRQAERAIAQVSDERLHVSLDPETNCIAVLMKHLAGNMRSRWTNFLTEDGEKPWRGRDSEFIDDGLPREELTARWEAGWALVFEVMGSLKSEDLSRTVTLRGAPMSVVQCILGHISHYAYHIGQIMLLAHHLARDTWQWLTIPPGESEQYNQRVWKR